MAIELVDLTPHASFVKAPTAIGVVRNGSRGALVDSGLDENLVRKVLRHLESEGVRIEAVINTHSHADHFGGNAFVHARTGAQVIAPSAEAAFLTHPELEPHTLFGASPPTALETKFLRAQACPVHRSVSGGDRIEVVGVEVKLHSLPGHSPDQLAIEVDGACFLGDALLPAPVLEKYGIAFAVDPGLQRESALRALSLGNRVFQTYHGGLVEDLRALVDSNLAAIDGVRDRVLAALEAPCTAEEAFERVAREFGWSLTPEQHALNFATVRGYLARLQREGKVRIEMRGPRMEWARA